MAVDDPEDEDAPPAMQMKKTKLSRQMQKAVAVSRGAVAPATEALQKRPSGLLGGRSERRRRKRQEGPVDGGVIDDSGSGGDSDEVLDVEPATVEPEGAGGKADASSGDASSGEDDSDDEEDDKADADEGRAARVARAQRAAARELQATGFADASASTAPPAYIPLQGNIPVPGNIGTASSELRMLAKVGACGDDGDDSAADDDWAEQQMRLGGHGRHAGAVPFGPAGAAGGPVPAASRPACVNREKVAGAAPMGGDAAAWQKRAEKVPAPAEATEYIWQLVRDMEKGEKERAGHLQEADEQLEDATRQFEFVKTDSSAVESGLKVVQELEEFAVTAAGLLDAKMPKLLQAVEMLGQMEKSFVKRRLRNRTTRFVKALTAAGAELSRPAKEDDNNSSGSAQGGAMTKRPRPPVPEAREGWDTSSGSEDDDDAGGAGDRCELRDDRAAFCAAAQRQLAADVSDRFLAMESVLDPVREAKTKLKGSEYKQAYVPHSLPEVLALHVQLSLLWWDPLKLTLPRRLSSSGDEPEDTQKWGVRKPMLGTQLESFDWFDPLCGFTELKGDKDPDTELVPGLVQKCVFPEVGRRIRDCWDVSSSSQTRAVSDLLAECMLFDSEDGGPAFAGLVDDACERFKEMLARLAPEVFVPTTNTERWYGSAARRRLLWRCCKVARCGAMLEGKVPDDRLVPLLLDGVLTARIAPHLRQPRCCPEEMSVLEAFVSALPARWLAKGLPPCLATVRDALGPRAPRTPAAAATAATAANVLRMLQCHDEAHALQLLADGVPVGC